jgi:hypothetical protein
MLILRFFCENSPRIIAASGAERSINLNKAVANFEKHIFLSQTDLTRTGIISNCYKEMFEAGTTILVIPVFYQYLPVSAILVQILVNTSYPVSTRIFQYLQY